MFELALRSVRSNLSRFVATLVAIATGVGFLTAGSMLTTSIERSLGGEIDEQYAAVAAAVSPAGQDTEGGLERATLPTGLVATIGDVRGVRAIAGEFRGFTQFLDDNGEDESESVLSFDGPVVRNWIVDDELRPEDIEAGRPPAAEGEITIDRGTAEDRGLAVGDTTSIASATGPLGVTVVGITRFGAVDAVDSTGTLSAAEPFVFGLSGDGTPAFTRILVAAEPGVVGAALVRSIESVAGRGVTVVGGEQFRDDEKGQSAEILGVLAPILSGFSFLALFVCGFVIYNTFSVIVTQRTRELALLRAIAATPRQVWSSLALEGLIIGLVGALFGLALGSALTALLAAALEWFDLGLPPARIVLTPRIFLTGIAAGTIVTMVAVMIPAIKASVTAPVEAMRSSAVEERRFPRVRSIIALSMMALGVVAMLPGSGLLLGLGALSFWIGLFLAGPAFALAFAVLARTVLRPFGMASRLSAENLGRNPRRTSTTANALVLGVFLITLVTISGESLKTYATREVDKLSSADFIIGSIRGNLPDGALDKVAAIEGVEDLARISQLQVRIDDHPDTISAADPADLAAVGVTASVGSLDDLDGGIALAQTGTQAVVGDTLTYTKLDGSEVTLQVRALLDLTFDSFVTGSVVSPETMAELDPTVGETTALLTVKPEAAKAVKRQLNDTFRGYSNVTVLEGNLFGRLIGQVFDFLINSVNALLGMSIVIALIGIINTLTLSIFERRRELGLLRAVGMSISELARMTVLEALQIALLGTVLGMLAGGVLAVLLLQATDLGTISFDWAKLGVVFGLGIGVGLFASLYPTYRVTKLDLLDSLSVA